MGCKSSLGEGIVFSHYAPNGERLAIFKAKGEKYCGKERLNDFKEISN